jgi:hypothetical protein
MDEVMMDDNELLKEIRDRSKEAYDALDESYKQMKDDLEFLNGDTQWPPNIKSERENDDQICLTINKMPSFVDRVTGDLRVNTPSIKVKPVDSKADPETAEKITGLIRNIEVQSNAEIAYDTAVEGAASCGKGTFRIITQYSDEETFNQEIRIKRVKNTFTSYPDPAAQEWDKSDALYWIITEKMSREEFKAEHPDAAVHEFSVGKDNDPWWGDEKSIRVAEYFKVEIDKKRLYLYSDPDGREFTSTEKLSDPEVTEIKSRELEQRKVMWWKVSGSEILEGPTEIPGKYIPIVEVYGKELNIEGKSIYRGVIRHAKDSQRLYNFSRSQNAEVVSLAPKAPFIVTSTMIKNYQNFWNKANRKNLPYLPYDVDPNQPLAQPKRADPISQNTGLLAEIQIADQEMHDTTAIQLASMGKKSNEKSGKAIDARNREADIGNFAYYDNLARALKYAGKIIIDLLPRIYDTPRVERILGDDGSEEFVPFNQPHQDETGKDRIFDLTTGKYDVVVTIGPSYQTQREEAADGMRELFGALSDQQKAITADLFVKNLDWPGAQEIEKRLKKLLPPGLVKEEDGGAPEQPPQQPNPMEMLAMKKAEQEIKNLELDGMKTRAEIDKLNAETREKWGKAAIQEMGAQGEG